MAIMSCLNKEIQRRKESVEGVRRRNCISGVTFQLYLTQLKIRYKVIDRYISVHTGLEQSPGPTFDLVTKII